MPTFELHCGDSIEVMGTMAEGSVDAVVTDSPYGLGFMGKGWDKTGIANSVDMWSQVLRVLKPGGHLLAFSGSRTYHRMACAIEDAGFELRDQIMWLYGSGFPKSRNLGGEWKGWGTALKPAHEPICVARKPLQGTVAENVLQFGTGAINIDGCRVMPTGESRERLGEPSQDRRYSDAGGTDFAALPGVRGGDPLGRWPANIIHDGSDEVIAAFPNAPGQMAKVRGTEPTANGFSGPVMYGGFIGRRESAEPRIDTSESAARFFYCAKATRADRNEGCDELPDRAGGMTSNTSGQHITRRDGWQPEPVKNDHPTVKPTELMAYLCRLVTPPGGVVLDPFMGSGSTGKACMREGFAFIGIDLSPEYVEIARARITHAAEKPRQISLFEVMA
ncbi:DNA-methyltransferase [Ralstonia insidiosa]|uniref:Methyltransferase n=1 Tax=Ralstonia insidiosa TaxID=190721 RepID=A0A848NVW3_9RALS|nr:site-specific DNA-methyltransferase [Ralstonia insidiosa]NMV37225.1 site-specific DNA-methyltransferase [Ralstonia insidiosa]